LYVLLFLTYQLNIGYSMTTRGEREKQQRQNEKYKLILAKLLAKEENKFCADCLSKGKCFVNTSVRSKSSGTCENSLFARGFAWA